MASACYHLCMRKFSLPSILTVLAATCVFVACSPKFDWRDYRSADAPYNALFPGKPSTHTRSIDLDGMQVDMTMTAAEVNGNTFAVGSATLPDAAKAPAALLAMKTALINNIGGKATPAVTSGNAIEVEASGMQNGKPVLLVGRFLAQDKRIYQVIVLSKEKQISRENIDMFMGSFKLN
jgi:hypothetical protein